MYESPFDLNLPYLRAFWIRHFTNSWPQCLPSSRVSVAMSINYNSRERAIQISHRPKTYLHIFVRSFTKLLHNHNFSTFMLVHKKHANKYTDLQEHFNDSVSLPASQGGEIAHT